MAARRRFLAEVEVAERERVQSCRREVPCVKLKDPKSEMEMDRIWVFKDDKELAS